MLTHSTHRYLFLASAIVATLSMVQTSTANTARNNIPIEQRLVSGNEKSDVLYVWTCISDRQQVYAYMFFDAGYDQRYPGTRLGIEYLVHGEDDIQKTALSWEPQSHEVIAISYAAVGNPKTIWQSVKFADEGSKIIVESDKQGELYCAKTHHKGTL